LPHIELIDTPFISSLKELANCLELENVKINQSNISSLHGIEQLNKLAVLNIADNSSLADISAIAYADSIEEIDMDDCYFVHDFSALEKLKRLKLINIDYGVSDLPVSIQDKIQ